MRFIVNSYMGRGEAQKAIDRVEAQLKAAPCNPYFYNLLGALY